MQCLAELVTTAAGLSFGDDVLRVHTDDEAAGPRAGDRVWPEWAPRIRPAGACVGFRTPLFLGAAETVENLEVVDEAVYWTVHGQLWAGVKDLPEGTPVSGVEIR
ncbi:hypothetical protein [Lentzea flaviverrucosa]|uniref:Uncharacterized protein n=1 Tax=Lentzea flaviverrucosa TaxID=200379 RepID=A0A1H9U1I0_9PSEU|nr:hypothetical protein [Lentzea flaviverrucosa]RDI33347.1 hypothetical protein DFR72_102596 [Lentzea flaviverrucosa]SES03470.1 hypothetical protein SAMN05216195_108261 [Lentzea flaviverrucosa]